jgi:tRNA wybutosine-synthesizing protein 3
MHVHGNVGDAPGQLDDWGASVASSIQQLAATVGKNWTVSCVHVERVKSYAPHIWHAVADVVCTAASK